MKKPKRKFGNFCGTLNLGEIGLDHWRGFCGTFKLKLEPGNVSRRAVRGQKARFDVFWQIVNISPASDDFLQFKSIQGNQFHGKNPSSKAHSSSQQLDVLFWYCWYNGCMNMFNLFHCTNNNSLISWMFSWRLSFGKYSSVFWAPIWPVHIFARFLSDHHSHTSHTTHIICRTKVFKVKDTIFKSFPIL